MPHRVQTRKSAVSRPKRYRRSSSGWWTVITTRPLGSEVVRAPCLRQKEHVSARSESSSGRTFVSSASSTLPQWQHPASGASIRGVSRPLIAPSLWTLRQYPHGKWTTSSFIPSGSAKKTPLFDDLLLETLHERDHVALFGLGHLELRQGRGGMTEEHVPVAFADAHASVGEHHVPAAIVHRSARARAEEVDQELLLALDAVFSAMRPEAGELGIGLEPGQQVIRHRRDRVVPAQALVKRFPRVVHRVLLESVGRPPRLVSASLPRWTGPSPLRSVV